MSWNKITLNLPGDSLYDPKLPWLYTYNSSTGRIAGDASTYLDNISPTGPNEYLCERIFHRIVSRSNYLGEQDAPRNRREPSRSPGLWNGSLIITDEDNVFVSTSVEK